MNAIRSILEWWNTIKIEVLSYFSLSLFIVPVLLVIFAKSTISNYGKVTKINLYDNVSIVLAIFIFLALLSTAITLSILYDKKKKYVFLININVFLLIIIGLILIANISNDVNNNSIINWLIFGLVLIPIVMILIYDIKLLVNKIFKSMDSLDKEEKIKAVAMPLILLIGGYILGKL